MLYLRPLLRHLAEGVGVCYVCTMQRVKKVCQDMGKLATIGMIFVSVFVAREGGGAE